MYLNLSFYVFVRDNLMDRKIERPPLCLKTKEGILPKSVTCTLTPSQYTMEKQKSHITTRFFFFILCSHCQNQRPLSHETHFHTFFDNIKLKQDSYPRVYVLLFRLMSTRFSVRIGPDITVPFHLRKGSLSLQTELYKSDDLFHRNTW